MKGTGLDGQCCLCGGPLRKPTAARHLATCAPAHDHAGGGPGRVFHLRAEGVGTPFYWTHLEAKATARLADLDGFLRRLWLECCGHLSAFRIGSTVYTVPMDDPFGTRHERSLSVRLSEALAAPPASFSYEYDFGSTTTLRLRVLGTREGAIGRRTVRLLARNAAPAWPCVVCREPAAFVCPYCMYADAAFVCTRHAPDHECEAGEDALLPVVNSPRMGVCGYTGDTPG